MSNQNKIVQWAKAIIDEDNWLVIDTETTGLDCDDEVIQLAIVDMDKNVLFQSKFEPTIPVSAGALKIHGLSDEALSGQPRFVDCYPQIVNLLNGKNIVGYNIAFDLRILDQTCEKYGLPQIDVLSSECAMAAFSEYYGDWSDYHQSYTWKSLVLGNAHEASADALGTVDVIKALAEVNND